MGKLILIYYAPRNATKQSSIEFICSHYGGDFRIVHIKNKFYEKTIYVKLASSRDSDAVASILNGQRFGDQTVAAEALKDTDPGFEPMI